MDRSQLQMHHMTACFLGLSYLVLSVQALWHYPLLAHTHQSHL